MVVLVNGAISVLMIGSGSVHQVSVSDSGSGLGSYSSSSLGSSVGSGSSGFSIP